MEQETTVPVYFAYEDEELLDIHNQIQQAVSSDQAASAAEGKIRKTNVAVQRKGMTVTDPHLVSLPLSCFGQNGPYSQRLAKLNPCLKCGLKSVLY